jgi:hypothetical protein
MQPSLAAPAHMTGGESAWARQVCGCVCVAQPACGLALQRLRQQDHAMIISNIFHRVIHLAHGDHTATGTMLHVEGREYLATSRHFAQLVSDSLEIYHNDRWLSVRSTLIGHCSEADISVLALPIAIIAKELTVTMTTNGMLYGEDVYFLGFPFGLSSKGVEATSNFPIPFVKRAIVSNFSDPEYGADFWLDGYNNVGFSGGPIISTPLGDPSNCILRGFICSYHTHPEDIEGPSGGAPSIYNANSGLIIAAKVERALDLIAANPCGPIVAA